MSLHPAFQTICDSFNRAQRSYDLEMLNDDRSDVQIEDDAAERIKEQREESLRLEHLERNRDNAMWDDVARARLRYEKLKEVMLAPQAL